MKALLRKLFAPILNVFEKGTEPYSYKPLNRKVLMALGALFSLLDVVVVLISERGGIAPSEYLIPVVVFGAVAVVALVVGCLGNERAVSKIWGSR